MEAWDQKKKKGGRLFLVRGRGRQLGGRVLTLLFLFLFSFFFFLFFLYKIMYLYLLFEWRIFYEMYVCSFLRVLVAPANLLISLDYIVFN